MKSVFAMTRKPECVLCGDTNNKFLFHNFDRLHGTPGIFNVVECCGCGLVYLFPRPGNPSDHYPDDYAPHYFPKAVFPETLTGKFLNSEVYYKKNKNLIEHLQSLVFEWLYNPIPVKYQGRVLDVGCGSGANLYNLRKFGWDVYGLDFSRKAVSFAKKQLHLNNVFVSTLERKKFPSGFFDVVFMSHVIEHLSDPVKAVTEVKRILKPGGLLLITTPNYESLGARLFKTFWFPLETPRHQCLFSEKTLRKMIELIGGLETINVRYSLAADCFAKSVSYRFGWPHDSCLLILIRIVILPLVFCLRIWRKSDVLTFQVIKR